MMTGTQETTELSDFSFAIFYLATKRKTAPSIDKI